MSPRRRRPTSSLSSSSSAVVSVAAIESAELCFARGIKSHCEALIHLQRPTKSNRDDGECDDSVNRQMRRHTGWRDLALSLFRSSPPPVSLFPSARFALPLRPFLFSAQAALLAGEPVLRGATSAPASLSPATWLPLGRSGPTPGAPRVVRTAGFRPGAAVAAAAGGRGTSKGGDRVSSSAVQQQVLLASVSQSTSAPPPVRPSQPSSYPGTPLMWVGVGVALSLFASWGSKFVMQRMQQAMMKQMLSAMQSGGGGPGGAANPFAAAGMGGGANPFPGMGGGGAANPFGGMPFPPPPPAASPSSSPSSSSSSPSSGSSKAKSSSTASKASAVVDVAAQVSDAKPAAAAAAAPSSATTSPSSSSSASSSSAASSAPAEEAESSSKKKSFFQDAELVEEPSGGGFSWGNTGSSTGSSGSNASNATWDTSTNSFANGGGGGGAKGKMTVEALEKMLEDPMVQKMVFPYLPEEMRDPATFKWMMQSPMYRQQLESMLDNMGGTGFDDRVLDMMKSFDLNSPEVKDQFSQLGMSPEDVVGKIMSNPKLAAAFQNPRLQAAILDVSPLVFGHEMAFQASQMSPL
ncbi:unnamed protein product [Closterium sp. NIES-65]|nr:unnamed protein product [Closterium sp. NIES-65]